MISNPLPADGDVLVTRPTATVVHEIAILPALPSASCLSHDQAIELATRLARERGVDAWLCEDHCHFIPIASFRHATATG